MTHKQKFLSSTALLLLVALPNVAHAQTAPAAQTPAAPAAAPKQADDDIIVTAERKPQLSQKYGGTVAVLSGTQIKELGIQNVTDLEGRIPGLQILANNNNIEVYIRGVGSSNNTELGDPAAGMYLDSIYIPRPSGIGQQFFDLDRVEVNIGPQGTIRGRNATAGSVNFIPWHPGLKTYDAYVEAGVGNYNQYTAEAMINLPITDNMAIRLSGTHSENGSYTHNLDAATQGLRGPEWANNFAGRAQLLYKPSDQFDMLLEYDNSNEIGGGTIGTNLAGAEGDGVSISSVSNPRDVYLYPTDPHLSTSHSGERGEFNYHAKSFNAQLLLGHRHLFSDWIGAPPGLLAYKGGQASADANDSTGAVATDYSHYETQTLSNADSQELRFTAPKGAKLDWTIGGLHLVEHQASFLGSTADLNPYFQGIEFNTRTNTESWAAYTDETFHVNDKLRVSAGIRYTEESKERTGVAARYLLALGDGHYGCCMGPVLGTPGFQFAGLSRTNFTTPDPSLTGAAQAQQALNYYLGGIKSFGVNDTVPGIFPGGILPTAPSGNCVDSPGNAKVGLFCATNGYNWGPPGSNGKYLYATIDQSEFFQQGASANYNFIDWRFRLEYDIAPNHLIYGLVSSGNKAGGFNDNFGTGGIAPTYKPENVINYEFGSKNKFTVGGLPMKFNITGFYESYNDQVLSSLLSIQSAANFVNATTGTKITFPSNFNPGSIIVNYNYNAANSVVAGSQVEAGLTIPPAHMNLTFNGLWLPEANVHSSQAIEDFRFQSDIDPLDAGFRSIAGKRLPRTPEVQLNMQMQQKFQSKLGVFDYVLAAGYRSKSYATIFNGEDYGYEAALAGKQLVDANGKLQTQTATAYRARLNDTVAAVWTLDIGAGYTTTNGKIRLEAFANNLLYKNNVTGILVSQTGGTVAFLPRPTTYGARLHYRF
jgi:iron complex outermembrane recepter protein